MDQPDLERLRVRVAELEYGSADEPKELLTALLAALPAFVLRFDPELRIQFASRLVAGVQERDVLGAFALDFIPQQDHGRARAAIESVLATGTPAGYETMGPGPNGELRHYQVSVAPVREPDGRMGGCFVALDTSVVRERERAYEQRLRIALAATKVGLWSWDLATGELLWDDRMRQIIGCEPMTLPEYVARVVHPEIGKPCSEMASACSRRDISIP